MIRSPFAILAALLTLAVLPQSIFIDADAKWPIHNPDHTFGQFMMLMIVPIGITIVVLGLWAMKARLQPTAAK